MYKALFWGILTLYLDVNNEQIYTKPDRVTPTEENKAGKED